MSAQISSQDFQTLRFGPMWVFSAVTGSCCRFHPMEEAAFWRSVGAAAAVTGGLVHGVLASVMRDRTTYFAEFELDDRPVVSGLAAVVAALRGLDRTDARDYRATLAGLGEDVARARGPFGQGISREDAQMLLLVAELLTDEPLSRAFETSSA